LKSTIQDAIGMQLMPVGVIQTNRFPEGGLQFKEGAFGCVIAFLKSASRGKTAVFSRATFGCPGGGVGLGFGDCYEHFPGGIEHFLSTGNPEFCQTEFGRAVASRMPDLEEGEGYFKTPEIAASFIASLPITDIDKEYVVFKPLQEIQEGELPTVVVFLVNPDQLSALVVLANYGRHGNEHVTIPFAAACHTVGIIPFREAGSATPRAVIGLTDVTVRNKFAKDLLSFAIPYPMFLEMEANVGGSFLEKHNWQHLLERNSSEQDRV
jgi:uncharacterized protein (DUF169 family)